MSNAIEFHLQHNVKKDDVPLEQQIPEAYHAYLDVFNERKALNNDHGITKSN